MHRVVITGTGVVSPFGNNTASFWQALLAGTSAIREMVGIDVTQVRFKNGAEIRDYVPEEHFEAKEIPFMDRFAQFAVLAAREAIAEAGIEWTPELRETTAVITGSCLGGRAAEEAGYWELFHNGRNRVQPLTIPLSMSNAGASHICMQFGIEGPSLHGIDGLCFFQPRDRSGFLDGSFRCCSNGNCGRQRGSFLPWAD